MADVLSTLTFSSFFAGRLACKTGAKVTMAVRQESLSLCFNTEIWAYKWHSILQRPQSVMVAPSNTGSGPLSFPLLSGSFSFCLLASIWLHLAKCSLYDQKHLFISQDRYHHSRIQRALIGMKQTLHYDPLFLQDMNV